MLTHMHTLKMSYYIFKVKATAKCKLHIRRSPLQRGGDEINTCKNADAFSPPMPALLGGGE